MTELALLWNATLQVVHVAVEFALNDQQLTNQKLLKKRLSNLNVMFYNIDFEANVAHTLEKFIINIFLLKEDFISPNRFRSIMKSS